MVFKTPSLQLKTTPYYCTYKLIIQTCPEGPNTRLSSRKGYQISSIINYLAQLTFYRLSIFRTYLLPQKIWNKILVNKEYVFITMDIFKWISSNIMIILWKIFKWVSSLSKWKIRVGMRNSPGNFGPCEMYVAKDLY